MLFDKITIIGIGLIGSSLARVIMKKGLAGKLCAYDKNPGVLHVRLSLSGRAAGHGGRAVGGPGGLTMRNVIPTFFTTNAEVIAIASQLMVFAALYQLSDGIQNVSVGILRGIQDVKIIMPIAFLSYIVFNLPVGYLLGFTLGMGAQGLILGFTVGLTTAAVLLIVRYRRDIRRWKAGIR